MKVLITGAHFTPAQAVIEKLKKYQNIEIIYVGRKHTQEGDKTVSIESQVLPKLGVKHIPIIAGRMRRIPDFYTLLSLFKIPIGFLQTLIILLKEKPDVVLSFGGYVAVPSVILAWLFSIPIITHEQTLVSGLASQISNFFADKIALTFDHSDESEKIVITGNPLRKEILVPSQNLSKNVQQFISRKNRSNTPLIYITGGNQGSDVINKTIYEILEDLTQKFEVIHQTGDSKQSYYNLLSEKSKSLNLQNKYLAQKWFDAHDVGAILKNADLVISRAGANTLLELSYFAKPSIIIPLPFIYKNEQVINAKFFNNLGLCQIIYQKQLNAKKLMGEVNQILSNYKKYKEDALNAKAIVVTDASKKLTQEVLILGYEHSQNR